MSTTAWLIGLGVAGLATGAVGMGMQYSAQKDAARQQEALARYNYAVQAQNIRQQEAMAQWSANVQARQAEANAAVARQTADANARNIESHAQATLQQGVEQQRRSREDQARFLARMMASTAKSQVLGGVGSPADAAVDAVQMMTLENYDNWFAMNTKRDSLLWDAQMERYGGEIGAANYSGQAGLLRAEGAMAPIKARMDLRRAGYERLAGLNTASGMNAAAGYGLASNAGGLLTNAYSLVYNTWGTPKSTAAPKTTSPTPSIATA